MHRIEGAVILFCEHRVTANSVYIFYKAFELFEINENVYTKRIILGYVRIHRVRDFRRSKLKSGIMSQTTSDFVFLLCRNIHLIPHYCACLRDYFLFATNFILNIYSESVRCDANTQ